MAQIYKIFINECPLIIANLGAVVEGHEECIDKPAEAYSNLLELIKTFEQRKSKGVILRTSQVDDLAQKLFSQFIVINAAGGVVLNDKQELLLIKRLGKWDLPKGKVDQGESIEHAAVREVEEEAGVRDLVLGKHLANSYHTYKHQGHRFLKTTYWYRMTTTYKGDLEPQIEEKITKAIWTDPKQLDIRNLDSYRSIIDVLLKAFK